MTAASLPDADPVVEVVDDLGEYGQRVLAGRGGASRRGGIVAPGSGAAAAVVPSGGHGYVDVVPFGGAGDGGGDVGARVLGGLAGEPEEQPGALAAGRLGLAAVGPGLDAVVDAVDGAVVEGRAGRRCRLVVVELASRAVLADDVAPQQTTRHFFLSFFLLRGLLIFFYMLIVVFGRSSECVWLKKKRRRRRS